MYSRLSLLLRGLGYHGGSEEYGYEEPLPDKRIPQPLDPIEVAGNISSKRLCQLIPGWKCALIIIGILHSISALEAIYVPPTSTDKDRRIEYTGQKYVSHLAHLLQAGVLEECAVTRIKQFGSYFSVPKTDTADRSIFNGAKLSQYFVSPPPTGLADISMICRKLAEFVRHHPRVYGFSLDIRHYFHQLKIQEELQAFFGLKCGDKCYRYKVLPMGWTFSPVIAQAAGWALLAGREVNQSALFREESMSDPELPFFLFPVEAAGLAVLYYDNLLVITSDAAATERIKQRFAENITKCGSLPFERVIKECTSFSHKSLRKNPLCFLGCEFTMRCKSIDDSMQLSLMWRIRPEKIPTALTWGTPGTLREIAQKLGKVIYGLALRLRPIGASSLGFDVLNLLGRIGKASMTEGWDTRAALLPNDMEVLESGLRFLQSNEWNTYWPRPPPGLVIVSDASDVGYGWCIIDVNSSRLVAARSYKWKPAFLALHIFRKEAYAALCALRHARRLSQESMAVLVDNTAVAGVLKRGHSFCPIVQRWIAAANIDLSRVDVHSIVSADNVADPLSRLMPTSISLPFVQQLLDHLQNGRRTGLRKRDNNESADELDEWANQEGMNEALGLEQDDDG